MDPEHCIFILGFGLAGYRSFGPDMQRIGPCKKINLVIGQNNSGKSNVLRFIQDRYCATPEEVFGVGRKSLEELEQHRGLQSSKFAFSFMAKSEDSHLKKWVSAYGNGASSITKLIKQAIESASIERNGEIFWIDCEATHGYDRAQLVPEYMARLLQADQNRLFYNLAKAVHQSAHSNDPSSNISSVMLWLIRELVNPPPRCITIPAIRQPGTSEVGDEKSFTYSGDQIIHRLAKLQNPAHNQQHLREDFRRVEHFLQEVTERPDAWLEVPHMRDTITVHMDGRSMPLNALGTGIHEVIILAAAATSLHKHVICIEEPEIHLHPLLQKKLLRYLDAQTDNQYFISTHSAHLLDHPGAAIFHVRLTERGSAVTPAVDASERFAICADLGYRASDLLQTNCIIWVEGPSDRIYLREWIRLCDDELTEGIDYSIMFYAGRLLSHLSPTDPEVIEFISLRLLNRNMIVVMDSDCRTGKQTINATKQRIVDAWKNEPGFAWVTQGREIENYAPPSVILEALEAVAPKRGPHSAPANRFSQCIKTDKKGNPVADKVKVAHWLADHRKLTLDVLDLKVRIKALRDFIHKANHVATATSARASSKSPALHGSARLPLSSEDE